MQTASLPSPFEPTADATHDHLVDLLWALDGYFQDEWCDGDAWSGLTDDCLSPDGFPPRTLDRTLHRAIELLEDGDSFGPDIVRIVDRTSPPMTRGMRMLHERCKAGWSWEDWQAANDVYRREAEPQLAMAVADRLAWALGERS